MKLRGEAGRVSGLPSLSVATATSLLFHVVVILVLLMWFRDGGDVSAPLPSYTAVLLPKAAAVAKVPVVDPRDVPSAGQLRPTKADPAAARKVTPRDTQPTSDAVGTSRVLPPAPAYKPRMSLEKGPVPLVDIEPKYPPEAGGVQGTVVLRLLINEAGGVDDAAVVSAFPPELFDAAAIDAFRNVRFAPGRQLGVPVKSQLMIEVKFQSFNKGAVGGRSM
jgi:TonB family protein